VPIDCRSHRDHENGPPTILLDFHKIRAIGWCWSKETESRPAVFRDVIDASIRDPSSSTHECKFLFSRSVLKLNNPQVHITRWDIIRT
jgi:hypothetical protein